MIFHSKYSLQALAAILAFTGLAVLNVRSAKGQENYSIRIVGSVVDSELNTALVGVNVFVSGSTIGAASDEDGQFEFNYSNPQLEFDVTASMIGFEIQKAHIKRGTDSVIELHFRLPPKIVELAGIAVIASNKDWKDNLERFEKLLFSSTQNGSDCEIVNTEVLSFSFDAQTEVLDVFAAGPLVIQNTALGYSVTIHGFELHGNDAQLIWGGEMQFQNLEPRNETQKEKWLEARDTAYYGSSRHFLRSIIKGTYKEEGFRIAEVAQPGVVLDDAEFVPKVSVEPVPSTVLGASENLYSVWFNKVLYVTYLHEGEGMRYTSYLDANGLRPISDYERRTRQVSSNGIQGSWLTMPATSVLVDSNGLELGENAFGRSGYWAWERMGEMLPSDFVPNKPQDH